MTTGRQYTRQQLVLLGVAFAIIIGVIVWNQSQANSARPAGYVSRAVMQTEWPLTVTDGVLVCDKASKAITFQSGGNTYAVNGTAKDLFRSMKKIDEIWTTSPAGAQVDLGPLINRGLALCS